MIFDQFKVVIPARYASTRLPAKPLLDICGKPIFWHVLQRVLESGIKIDDIIIATDDHRIQAKARELDLPVILTSVEHISGTDRINEVATRLKWTAKQFVINVQGDEPLIPPQLIRQLINFVKSNSQFDIYTAITAINNYDDFINPNVVKAVTTEYNQAIFFTRSAAPLNRDDLEDFSNAKRHIGIYAYSVKTLSNICNLPESMLERIEKLEQLRALSNKLTIGVMEYTADIPHGIDTDEDYIKVKSLMEKI